MSNLDYGTDPSRELAQWLQEVARRRYPMYGPSMRPPDPPRAPVERPRKWRRLREVVGLAALSGAYLQYYMLDVMLQIATMKSVTVFV
jgi:hypothetical protein